MATELRPVSLGFIRAVTPNLLSDAASLYILIRMKTEQKHLKTLKLLPPCSLEEETQTQPCAPQSLLPSVSHLEGWGGVQAGFSVPRAPWV